MSWKSRFWLRRDQNLADLSSASTARTNLDLGTAATKAASNNSDATLVSITGASVVNNFPQFGDTVGTVGDSGWSPSSFFKVSNNLSEGTASTIKTNLGFKTADINLGDVNGTASSRVTGTHGLGGMPLLASAWVKNISGGTQNGYAANEYVQITQGGTSRNDGGSLSMTTTNVTFNVGANGVLIMDAGTFNGVLVGGLGAGKWEIHIRAIIW